MVVMQKMVDFLYEDLPHLFDDKGIDRTAYEERLNFRDPISKHDSISSYLFNIAALRALFKPKYKLHWVKQTGTNEITARWTVVMKLSFLPWRHKIAFTGTSVMGINPETKKFCSQVDSWDSVQNNNFFSMEGLLDVVKQLHIWVSPDLETPKYKILKRTASYEVRKYKAFNVIETDTDKLSASTGFSSVAGYIFGKNSTMETIPMTTPLLTEAFDVGLSKVSIQIVLPRGKDISSFPSPNEEEIKLRNVKGGIAAVSKFSGKPVEHITREKEESLRSALVKDGLKPKVGCLLARYNNLAEKLSIVMRNEIIIWLEQFSLD